MALGICYRWASGAQVRVVSTRSLLKQSVQLRHRPWRWVPGGAVEHKSTRQAASYQNLVAVEAKLAEVSSADAPTGPAGCKSGDILTFPDIAVTVLSHMA